jgi:hypothetical protein
MDDKPTDDDPPWVVIPFGAKVATYLESRVRGAVEVGRRGENDGYDILLRYSSLEDKDVSVSGWRLEAGES